MIRPDPAIIRIETICLEDERYRITREQDLGALIRSIEHLGMINPPVLEQSPEGYRVVTGFRRLQAYRRLDRTQIEARLVNHTCREIDCLKLAIADNAMSRPLDILEEATAVVKLSAHFTDPRTFRETAALLGISVNSQLADKYRCLLRLPEGIRQQVASGVMPLAIALELESVDMPSALAVAGLFSMVQPTLSQQRELLSFMRDIAAAAGKSLSELIDEPTIAEICHADLDRKQKIVLLRSAIRRWRYPHLSRAEADFIDRRKKLDLPSGMVLQPPKDFESPAYNLTLIFETPDDLRQQSERLQEISLHPELHAILERDIEDP